MLIMRLGLTRWRGASSEVVESFVMIPRSTRSLCCEMSTRGHSRGRLMKGFNFCLCVWQVIIKVSPFCTFISGLPGCNLQGSWCWTSRYQISPDDSLLDRCEKIAVLVLCSSRSPLIHLPSVSPVLSRCRGAQLNSSFSFSPFSPVLLSALLLLCSPLSSQHTISSFSSVRFVLPWLWRLNLLTKHTKSHMCICKKEKEGWKK